MCVTLALMFTKLSVILLYQRIFHTGGRFRTVTYIMLGLVSMWGVAITLGYLLQCVPVRLNWESTTGEIRKHCFNTVTFNNVACASNVVLDVAILTLPWPVIWRMHMSPRRKTAVTGIFLLGGV